MNLWKELYYKKAKNSRRTKCYKRCSKCHPHFPTCRCLLQQVLKYFLRHVNIHEVNTLHDFHLQFFNRCSIMSKNFVFHSPTRRNHTAINQGWEEQNFVSNTIHIVSTFCIVYCTFCIVYCTFCIVYCASCLTGFPPECAFVIFIIKLGTFALNKGHPIGKRKTSGVIMLISIYQWWWLTTSKVIQAFAASSITSKWFSTRGHQFLIK